MSPWLALEISLDFGLPLLLAAIAVHLLRRAHRPRNTPIPTCHNCGYILTGASTPACPECGHNNTEKPTNRFKHLRKRRIALALLLMIPFLWVLWISITLYSWALPQHFAAWRLNQTWSSGAYSKCDVFTFTKSSLSTSAANKSGPGLWLTTQIAALIGQQGDPRTLVSIEQVGLKPNPSLAPAVQWSCFFIQWVFWPADHYRRYVPDSRSIRICTIQNAASRDAAIFQLIPPLRSVWLLDVSHSHIDAHAIRQISRLQNLSALTLNTIHAAPADLAPLSTLTNLRAVTLAFNRTLEPQDLAFLAGAKDLSELRISALSIAPACDPVLAQLLTNRTNLSLELHYSLPMGTPSLVKTPLPLTTQAATLIGRNLTIQQAGTQPALPITPLTP